MSLVVLEAAIENGSIQLASCFALCVFSAVPTPLAASVALLVTLTLVDSPHWHEFDHQFESFLA